ncbi:hypothetical protein Btru_002700 [Bulinus truncatus]|nr:hypothetical protein Btru_002700 [Bulinus truncatus]
MVIREAMCHLEKSLDLTFIPDDRRQAGQGQTKLNNGNSSAGIIGVETDLTRPVFVLYSYTPLCTPLPIELDSGWWGPGDDDPHRVSIKPRVCGRGGWNKQAYSSGCK